MKQTVLALLCIALAAQAAPAQEHNAPADTVHAGSPVATPASDADAISAVRALEARRQTALVSADTRALAEIFAEDATYVHANGIMQSRDELFSMLERGEMKYVAVKPEDVRYRAYDGTVIGTGVQRIDVESQGKLLVLRSRYTVVYVRSSAGWKLVAYESTATPTVTTRQ